MLYREGDIVTLRARVVFNQEPDDAQLHLDVEGDASKLIVDAKVVMLLQRAFRVGDKVRMGEWHGTVLATSGTGTIGSWVKDEKAEFLAGGE